MFGDKWDEDLSNVSEWFVDSFGFINKSQLNIAKKHVFIEWKLCILVKSVK